MRLDVANMNNAHHFIRKGIYISYPPFSLFLWTVTCTAETHLDFSSSSLHLFFFFCHPTFLLTVKTAAESLYYDDKFCGRISFIFGIYLLLLLLLFDDYYYYYICFEGFCCHCLVIWHCWATTKERRATRRHCKYIIHTTKQT